LENRKKNVIIILSSLKEKGGYNITVGLGFVLALLVFIKEGGDYEKP